MDFSPRWDFRSDRRAPTLDGFVPCDRLRRFYCRRCEMMTAPRAELEAQMEAKPEDAIGIVAGWPVTLQIEPIAR